MNCPGCGQPVDVEQSEAEVKTEASGPDKGQVTIRQGGRVVHQCGKGGEGASSSGH
jgi:hypothetical protein